MLVPPCSFSTGAGEGHGHQGTGVTLVPTLSRLPAFRTSSGPSLGCQAVGSILRGSRSLQDPVGIRNAFLRTDDRFNDLLIRQAAVWLAGSEGHEHLLILGIREGRQHHFRGSGGDHSTGNCTS